MKPESVNIIYAKSTNELLNRGSALGSYIHCLCGILSKHYTVYINGREFKNLSADLYNNNISKTDSGSFLKKILPRFLKNSLRDYVQLKKMKAFSRSEVCAAGDVLMEFYSYGSDAGRFGAKKYNKKLIVIFDAPVIEENEFFTGKKIFFKKRIKNYQDQTLINADKIVVYSNPVKEYVSLITKKRSNIFIHQNVDFTRFDFIEPKKWGDKITIGFIGSFLKWHNVDFLVEAVARLKSEGKEVRLLLIGNGMEYTRISEMVNKLNLQEYVVMTGFLDGESLLRIKKEIHIGVMPGSNWYGAPNKIFEYGAAGMAVLAPATPTIKDLFDKQIRFFEPGNKNDLYQVLLEMISNAENTYLLSCLLHKEIMERYSAELTEKFYCELIEK